MLDYFALGLLIFVGLVLFYGIILLLYFVLSLVISVIIALLERRFSPTRERRSLLTALTGRTQGVS